MTNYRAGTWMTWGMRTTDEEMFKVKMEFSSDEEVDWILFDR